MNIALYFGSFNPVHNGHTQLAQFLIDNKIADEVWFIVSPCNPLKNQSDLLDEYIRLDMLILATRNQPAFKVSDIEFMMAVPSFTIDTLRKISIDFPENNYALLIGSDNAMVFDQWKEYQQILDTFPVYVYPRSGYDFSSVKSLFPQMKLLPTPYFDISSTTIRQAIAEKKDIAKWLHPSVYEFITENNLYK